MESSYNISVVMVLCKTAHIRRLKSIKNIHLVFCVRQGQAHIWVVPGLEKNIQLTFIMNFIKCEGPLDVCFEGKWANPMRTPSPLHPAPFDQLFIF